MVQTMLHVMAVDDELPALHELAYLLRTHPRVAHVVEVAEAARALRVMSVMIQRGEPLHAVFLDIRMPELDGLDISRFLAGFAAPPPVVFVTAHDEFAVAAYDLGALDYLLKPVRPERLAESIRRVENAVSAAPPPAETGVGEPDEMIPVELGGRTRMISRAEVLYVEAHGDYVRLRTAEGRFLVRMPLATLTRRWEAAGFIRIHRSTLVAAAHIKELRNENGRTVVRVGDETLPISRRHTREVRELLTGGFRMPRTTK